MQDERNIAQKNLEAKTAEITFQKKLQKLETERLQNQMDRSDSLRQESEATVAVLKEKNQKLIDKMESDRQHLEKEQQRLQDQLEELKKNSRSTPNYEDKPGLR